MSADITVVLVTCNHEDYVERAIASIEAQVTGRSVEVVVADDSSDDRTREIVSEWAKRSRFSVRLLDAHERLGITANYARAFAAASGTYVAVLEGDDEWIAVDKLDRQADALEASPQLAMAASRVLLYDDEQGGSRVIPLIGSDRFLTEVTQRQLANANWFATFSCCMYRTEVLRRLDHEVFAVTSYDWMVNLAVLEHGNAVLLPQVMTLYRQHAGGAWSQADQRERDLQLQQVIPEYIRILGPEVSHELARVAHDIEKRLRDGSAPVAQHDVAVDAAVPVPRVTTVSAPRVSVVMAVYNHEPFILEAVSSVLAQTSSDLELVIVDDGSTDGSMRTLCDIDDPRVRIYQLAENQGAAAALNIAIQQSRARLIAVMNSDDAWEPAKLERQLAVLDERPEVGAVFTNVRLVGADGRPLAPERLPEWNGIFRQRNRSQGAWLRTFFEDGNCLCHPSALIRREFYERHGLMNNRMSQIADLRQWVTLVKHYPIVVLDEELVRFRLLPFDASTGGSSEANVLRGIREHLELNEHFFDDCDDEMVIDGFGDVLRDPLFHTADERACALAFLWFDLQGPKHNVNRIQGLRALRTLLDDPATSLLLRTRYGVTDLTMHDLAATPDDLPVSESAQWVTSGTRSEHGHALAFVSSGQLLRILIARMRRAGPRSWPARVRVALAIARAHRS